MAVKAKMFTLVCLFLIGFLPNQTHAEDGNLWVSGDYSFSDELGGFQILGISGSGSRDDPITIHQELSTSRSAILVIRPLNFPKVQYTLGLVSNGALYLRLVIHNKSNLPWIGYGLELQEILDQPSIYGDGLSFDQLSREDDHITSDRFLSHELQFEPGDRLVYTDGWVDHLTSVSMNFKITDFTPVERFFLFQDPQIPAS